MSKLDNNRVLSSLCYFSIFFAGFILPVIVYFAANNQEVKHHAKRAFISHLLLLIPTIIGVVLFIALLASSAFTFNVSFANESSSGGGTFIIVAWFVFIIVETILSLGVVIWNIIQGVKILRV
ncbi:DUF4870 domain-containing protein [Rummeliibacillus sp. JY-2-4R]